jgi:signal peptidase II
MLVSFDQLTKLIVSEKFQEGQSKPVLENFLQLTLVHNRGAAFGIMANLAPSVRDPLLFLVPCAVLALILFAFSRLQESQTLSIYALACVVGGAAGNIMDRLRLGYVVDFLDFHWQNQNHFPAFNLADIAISFGVGLLFLSIFFEQPKLEEEIPAEA